MKNILFVLIALSIASCKSFDAKMIQAVNDPLSPKLPTLNKQIEDLANTTVVMNSKEMNLITDEIEKNMVNIYGEKVGTIAIRRTVLDSKLGMGWAIISGFTLMVPNLFGMPMYASSQELEVEVRILSLKNELIGKYKAYGKGKANVALYHGYNMKGAINKAMTDAYNDAFKQIREKMQPELPRLIAELEK